MGCVAFFCWDLLSPCIPFESTRLHVPSCTSTIQRMINPRPPRPGIRRFRASVQTRRSRSISTATLLSPPAKPETSRKVPTVDFKALLREGSTALQDRSIYARSQFPVVPSRNRWCRGLTWQRASMYTVDIECPTPKVTIRRVPHGKVNSLMARQASNYSMMRCHSAVKP